MDDLNVTQPANNNNSNEPTGLQEEWRWIPDDRVIPNTYQVSNLGRVRNVQKNLLLKLSVPKKLGYRIAVLPKAGTSMPRKYVGVYVHRAVAKLFLPAPLPEQTQVDHIDGDKLNNRVDNLRWVSPRDNVLNPVTRQHAQDKYEERAKKLFVPVICISDNNREFASIKEAAAYYDLDPVTVSGSCRNYGKPRHHVVPFRNGKKLYQFRYANISQPAYEDDPVSEASESVAYNAKAVVYMGEKEDKWFPTIREAARKFHVAPAGIAKACNKQRAGAVRHKRSGICKLAFRWATPEDKPQPEQEQD